MTTTASRNWQTWCDTCAEYVATNHEHACAWCAGAVRTRLRTRTVEQAPVFCMSEEVIEAATTAYRAGYGMPSIAKALHHRTTYSNPKMLELAIGRTFRRRGVKIRTTAATTSIRMNRRHEARREGAEFGTRCAGITKAGKQCLRDALAGDTLCFYHHPVRKGEAAAVGLATQQRIRSDRVMLSEVAPRIIAWRDGFEGKSWKAAARRVSGIPEGTLGVMLHQHAKGGDRYLTPETERRIKKMLATPPEHARRVAS